MAPLLPVFPLGHHQDQALFFREFLQFGEEFPFLLLAFILDGSEPLLHGWGVERLGKP